MKNFDFSSGKFLGGVAIIFFGLLLLIENNESLPLVLIMLIIGLLLISSEINLFLSKKENKLLDRCIVLIDKYESQLSLGTVSCKTIMIEKINLATMKTNIPIENLDKTCHILLGNIAFSLLASGEYHIYSGQLNVLDIAPSLHNVFIESTKWLHSNGHITDEDYQISMRNLNDAINKVG